MVSKEVFKEKIEEQLSKWKTTIDGLRVKLEQAEVDAKEKLHEQLDSLHDKRLIAERLLEDVSVTSQDAWEQVKAGVEQGWTDLTRTAKSTMGKVREAIARPKRDEEIRQIAYHLWLDAGCPNGRHEEHWLKAESIWRARQESQAATEAAPTPRATAKRPRKSAAPVNRPTPARKPKRPPSKKTPTQGPLEP